MGKATGIVPGLKKFNWTCSILKPFACICAKMTWTNHPGLTKTVTTSQAANESNITKELKIPTNSKNAFSDMEFDLLVANSKGIKQARIKRWDQAIFRQMEGVTLPGLFMGRRRYGHTRV